MQRNFRTFFVKRASSCGTSPALQKADDGQRSSDASIFPERGPPRSGISMASAAGILPTRRLQEADPRELGPPLAAATAAALTLSGLLRMHGFSAP
jgi:hypothetical protein